MGGTCSASSSGGSGAYVEVAVSGAGGAEAAPKPAGESQSSQPLPYCYVLYTSGSTGAPLGVCGTEQGVLNRCAWMQRAYPFHADDRVAFRTSPCFVDSIWEIFGPLLAGVPLLAVPQALATSPQQVLGFCATRKVTHLTAVPTLWMGLTACLKSSPDLCQGLALRLVVSSGEPLTPSLLARMQALLPQGTTILNLYGSTEAAADCTAFDCTSWQPGSPGRAWEAAARPAGAAGSTAGPHPAMASAGVPVGTHIDGMWVGVMTSTAEAGLSKMEPDFQLDPKAGPWGPGEESQSPTASEAGTPGPGDATCGSQVGEVVVGGVGLAAGYLHQPAATARRFVKVPMASLLASGRLLGCQTVAWPAERELLQPGDASVVAAAVQGSGALLVEAGAAAGGPDAGWAHAGSGTVRCFRTGDLGYVDAAGQLRLCGRRDLQVKIGGVRFDLSEVEAALSQHPAVHAAAAKLLDLQAGKGRAANACPLVSVGPALAAFVELVPESAPSVTSQALQDWCRQRLPLAAVPAAVVVLPRLPRSSGGKLQRAALPLPSGWQQQQQQQQEQEQQQTLQEGQATWSIQDLPAPAGKLIGRAAKRARHQQQQQDGSNHAAPSKQAAVAAQQQPQRPQLPAGQLHGQSPTVWPAPATGKPPTEVDIFGVFAAALQAFLPPLPPISQQQQRQQQPLFEPTTNIFHLGANSLVVGAISEGLGIPAELVYESPTVRGLAAKLRAAAHPGQQAHHSTARHAAGAWAGQPPAPVSSLAGPAQGLQAAARPLGQSLVDADLTAGTAGCSAGEGSGASLVGQPVRCGTLLQLAWKAPMLQCVDAPPLAVLLPADAIAAEGGQPSSQLVFASSHGGDVRCFDGSSGRQRWETVLPDRADVGLALCYPAEAPTPPKQQVQGSGPALGSLTAAAAAAAPTAGQHQGLANSPCLAVATNTGTVFFLDAWSGRVVGSVDVGGGLRAPPVVDPWAGLVWVASHAKELLVLQASGRVVARHPCSASVSAQVTFCESQRLAFVACLDGTLQALTVAPEELLTQPVDSATKEAGAGNDEVERQATVTAAAAAVAGPAGGANSSCFSAAAKGRNFLRVAWQHQAQAPLFTAPLVVEPCMQAAAGPSLVIAAAVDGSVVAVEAATGCQVWQCLLGSPVFAPILQLSAERAAAGASPAATASAGTGQVGDGCGRAAGRAPILVRRTRALQAVLVGTQAGDVHVLDVGSGAALARVPLSDRITSTCTLGGELHSPLLAAGSLLAAPTAAAAAAAAAAALPPALVTSKQGSSEQPPLVLITTQSGLVCLLAAGELAAGFPALSTPGAGRNSSVPGGGEGSCTALPVQTVELRQAAERHSATSKVLPAAPLDGCLRDVVRLPADVFSVPAVLPWSRGVVMGCRDDHVYCLQAARL
ncbi:hypothetical protein N2152v2_005358 [Parachlorella kessleri]